MPEITTQLMQPMPTKRIVRGSVVITEKELRIMHRDFGLKQEVMLTRIYEQLVENMDIKAREPEWLQLQRCRQGSE